MRVSPDRLRLRDRIELAIGRRLLRAPQPVIERLDRDPIVVDGQRLEARCRWVLALAARAGPPINELPVPAARRRFDLQQLAADCPPPAVATVWDRTVAGPAGRIAVRLYVPAGLRTHRPARGGAEGRGAPLLIYYHGGGFVVGSIQSHDVVCRILATETPCAVASVEYRLAPEDPFPAPVEDALAAYRALRTEAPALGLDPERIAVGGDSAGGSLSAAVAQLAHDDGIAPCGQLLIYPSTDPFGTWESAHFFREGFGLTVAMRDWFMGHYRPTENDVRAAPLRRKDLTGLAPACVVIAGFDPLRDEGLAYAHRLREANVPVELQTHPSLFHGFVQITGVVPAARAAMSEVAAGLARTMHT